MPKISRLCCYYEGIAQKEQLYLIFTSTDSMAHYQFVMDILGKIWKI